MLQYTDFKCHVCNINHTEEHFNSLSCNSCAGSIPMIHTQSFLTKIKQQLQFINIISGWELEGACKSIPFSEKPKSLKSHYQLQRWITGMHIYSIMQNCKTLSLHH